MLTLLIFTVLLIFIMSNLPIAIAMGLTAVLFFVGLGNAELLTMLPQRMFASTTGYTLLSIPFFILAGNLMNTGGVTNRICNFAKTLVGHITGGMGHVTVVAECIISGMSGSALADAAGMGQVMYRTMTKVGFKPSFAASIVGAASTLGPIIPPSIPFVLYGAMTSVSVGDLFIAGFLPGALMAVALMIAITIMAKIRKVPKAEQATFKEVFTSTKEAFWSLMAPVVIIGGILSGYFTPTEASVVACIYALILGFVYKDLKTSDLPEILWVSIKQTISLMFIMATAGFFGWLTIHQKIPDQLIAGLTNMNLSGGAVMAIIIGIAQRFGFDLLNFGVVMTLLIMVGNLTPPVGMCLFAVSSFSKVSVGELSKEVLPYLAGIFIVTILCAYIPEISTCIPYWLSGR
jgi:tripartite ATP-independent transporter DctM subunit